MKNIFLLLLSLFTLCFFLAGCITIVQPDGSSNSDSNLDNSNNNQNGNGDNQNNNNNNNGNNDQNTGGKKQSIDSLMNNINDRIKALSPSSIKEKIGSEKSVDELSADERILLGSDPNLDTDRDGIPDNDEEAGTYGFVTDPRDPDTDGDGLTDLREYWWVTDPTDSDTNGDFISDGESVDSREAYPYDLQTIGSLSTQDLDGDSIPTAAERYELKLNHKSFSSDGDRYGDGQELFGVDSKSEFLPGYVNADAYRPATPDIAVVVRPEVELIYDKTVTEGSDEKKSFSETMKSSKATKTSLTATVGAKTTLTATASSNPFKLGVEAKAEAYAGVEFQSSSTFSRERISSRQQLREIFARSETDFSNTKIRIWVDAQNIGDDILTSPLKEVLINYYIGNDEKPFATQELDTEITNLKPGDSVLLTDSDVTLSFDEFKRVSAGEGVTVKLAHYSFGEDQVYFENALSRGIRVLIDNDGIDEEYVIPLDEMTLSGLFEELDREHEFKDGSLFMFDGTEVKQTHPYKWWEVHIQRYDESDVVLAEDLASTVLAAGDLVVVQYAVDTDGDRVSDARELMFGSDPNEVDTDRDGLWDGPSFEQLDGDAVLQVTGEQTVGTNPILYDTDFDGFQDGLELDFETDPLSMESMPEGFIAYDTLDYEGDSFGVAGDIANLGEYSDWMDSVFFPSNKAAILFTEPNYEGKARVVTGAQPNLGDLRDTVSSVKLVDTEELGFSITLMNRYSSEKRGYNTCLTGNVDKKDEEEVVMYGCTTNTPSDIRAIKWKMVPYGSGYRFINELSNAQRSRDVCLEGNIEEGDSKEMQMYHCTDKTTSTEWWLRAGRNGWYNLVNAWSTGHRKVDSCLDGDIEQGDSTEANLYYCRDRSSTVEWKLVYNGMY